MVIGNNSYEIKKLRSCYIEWKKHKLPQSNQWFIPLKGVSEFNPSFINCLGDGNTKNIQYIDDSLLRNITAALVEHEANLQAHKKVIMTDNFSLLRTVNPYLYSELVPDGIPRWGMHTPDKLTAGWTEFIQKKVFPTKSIWNVVASIANILDVHTEYLDKQYNYTHSNLWNGGLPQFDYIPKELHLLRISSYTITAKLIETKLLYDKSRKIIGCIAQYSFNNQTFCLAVTNNNGILRIGKNRLPTCFLNQHLFDEKPKWKIIFCQDIRAALILQNIIEKYNNDTRYDFLVTGHLGTNLESFPWDFFYGHDIIFVPAASKFSLSQIGYYKKLFLDADVNEFRTFPGFLLHSPPRVELEQGKETLPPMEAALLRDTVVIEDKDMSLRGAQRIMEKAISYESFIKWGQDLGFFKKPKESLTTGARSEVQVLPPPDPSETPPVPLKLEDVVLHNIIRPSSNVLVLGAKNTGKTQIALSICAALRKKGALSSIFRNETIVPCNVAYVDAETLPDEFQANLSQYGLDNDAGFFGLCKHDKGKNNPFDTYSLMNSEFREGLQKYLVDKGCRYVVLDNLVALMGNRVDYGADVQEVVEWVEQLQDTGICPIIIHHLGDETQGKARGSKIFTFRARTIITLTGKNEILRDSEISEPIRNSAHRDGLTVGLRFDTCKAGAILEGMTFYAHLPFGAAHWEKLGCYGLDGKEIEFSGAEEVIAHPENAPPVAGDIPLNDKLNTLSPNQRKVVEILEDGPAPRAEIETKLNCCEDKALTVLNELIDMKVVRREGQSKATYYVLNNGE